jgi:hypothetical protein
MANGLIALFTDTVRETSETALRIREGYRNLISKAHYTSNYLLGGRSEEDVIHTGPVIRETLYLKLESTGKRFGGPGLTFDWTNKQTGTKVTAQMSYYANFIAWDELEIDLNADSAMGKEYIRAKFNDILRGKFQNLMMDTIEQFEDEKWAPANYAAMRTNYTAPMSIPYFITEDSGGLPIEEASSTAVADVLGISPATYPTWDNVRTTYGALGGALATGDDLIGRLLLAAQKTHFEALPMSPEHGELESMPNVVFCSDQGLSNVTSAMRAGQDTWGRRELSHLGVVLDNMVFKNITALNTALLYDNGTTLAAENDNTGTINTGPRYWGVSKASFKCLFMRDRYMAPDDPVQLTADGKPNDWVQVYKTYNQLLCLDRRRNFICSPSTDL